MDSLVLKKTNDSLMQAISFRKGYANL